MIDKRPKVVKFGFLLGILGGLLAILASIYAYDSTESSVINVGICLLVMILFLMLGGGFAPNGNGTWGVVTGIAAVTTGICIAMILYGNIDKWLGSAMAVIAMVIVLVAANRKTGLWIKANRIGKQN